MNKVTFQSRISALKISKNSLAYKAVIALSEGADSVRPVTTSGSGLYTSNVDNTTEISSILSKIGVEAVLTNDAPRGGLGGNLITLTAAGKRALATIRKEALAAKAEAKRIADEKQSLEAAALAARLQVGVDFAKANPEVWTKFKNREFKNREERLRFWGSITFFNKLGVNRSQIENIFYKIYKNG